MPPVLLIDGHCAICNGFLQWMLIRDRDHKMLFGAQQSAAAQALLSSLNLPATTLESLIWIEDGQAYFYSEAVLRAIGALGRHWRRAAGTLRLFPLAWRDWAYRWFAKNRFYWMKRREVCFLPTPEQKARFIDV